MKDLSTEELEALRTFASVYGRTWKYKLRQKWQGSSLTGPNAATLQSLRNDPGFGPAGLERFRP